MTSVDGISIKTTRSNRLKLRLHTNNHLIWVSDLVSLYVLERKESYKRKFFVKGKVRILSKQRKFFLPNSGVLLDSLDCNHNLFFMTLQLLSGS